MKIEQGTTPNSFKPIKLELTIETQDEFDMLFQLFGCPKRASDMLVGHVNTIDEPSLLNEDKVDEYFRLVYNELETIRTNNK